MARLVARYALGYGVLSVASDFTLDLYLVLRSTPKAIHERHKYAVDLWSGLYRKLSCSYPPHYTRARFRPMEEYADTQLVFFGKLHNASTESSQSGPTVESEADPQDSSVGTTRLQASLSPRKFTVLFTSSRSLRKPHIAQYVNHSNVLVAAIPNIYKVTGSKKEQYKAYQRVLNRYGCSIEDTRIMPQSYLLDNRARMLVFFQTVLQSDPLKCGLYLKTSQGYGGDGISIYSNVTKLRNKWRNTADHAIVKSSFKSTYKIYCWLRGLKI